MKIVRWRGLWPHPYLWYDKTSFGWICLASDWGKKTCYNQQLDKEKRNMCDKILWEATQILDKYLTKLFQQRGHGRVKSHIGK